MSGSTTFLGPVVSFRTSAVQSDQTVIVDARPARLLSRATTASATSLVLEDGELAVTNVSATSCRLAFRSGVTTYTIIATTGGVL